MIRNANDEHAEMTVVLEESFERLEDLTGQAQEPLEPEPVLVPERFTVDTAEKASWAVRKIVEARKYAERVKSWAHGELRRAEHEEQWLLRRFERELETWLRQELRRRGGRKRSVNLPGGTLGLRLQGSRVEILDETSVIPWCKSHLADAVRITVEVAGRAGAMLLRWQQRHATDARVHERVMREVLNDHVKETGEVPDGASLRPPEDRFYVK
jgi:hypothetical protein